MKMRTLAVSNTTLALGIHMALAIACTRDPVMSEGSSTTDEPMTGTTVTVVSTTGPMTPPADSSSGPPPIDLPGSTDTGQVPTCLVDGTCGEVDIVFVIDNSGSMGDEQLGLARSFQALVDELDQLQDASGNELNPSVNIMVTTTDMGHPLCTAFEKPDYDPRLGAPVYQGCNSRINRFTGLDPMMPVVIDEACTENCPVDIAPSAHFINFDIDGTNVPGDDVGAALACIGPQGIDGCGYESPLEAMLQAINEGACWNDPAQADCDEQPEWADVTEGFLRDDAMLAVVLATDELDCSVQPPDGYTFFTDLDNTVYWNENPELQLPQATSAICFNAGVTCTDDQGDGIYESCDVQDSEVLQPLSRYTQYFDYLASQGKEVVMLDLVGVPQVVSHNPELPYEPTEGGLADLLYRDWIDFPYPAGDILPDQWDLGYTAANKIFEFGNLGPGCFGQNDQGEIVSQALPPVRNRDVCQSLDYVDEDTGEPVVRCCIESVCESDFSAAFRCLTGTISQALTRTHG